MIPSTRLAPSPRALLCRGLTKHSAPVTDSSSDGVRDWSESRAAGEHTTGLRDVAGDYVEPPIR